MSRFILMTALIALLSVKMHSQCIVTASASPEEIVCGDCTELSAFGRGQGDVVFQEDFNSGAPSGWAFTQQARFDNPCSPNGVDGTTHIWMGNTSAVPRTLQTLPYNFSTAISGVTICFDMLFATQGVNAPCEGPDEPDEGVYIQYSLDGVSWNTIHYFNPNGGNDPQLVNWNNWCFQLPQAAIASNVSIRWFQDNDSGADYDHWGIDNVVIYFNDPTYVITWLHDNYSYATGSSGGVNPNPACSIADIDYIVRMTNGTFTCFDTISIAVVDPEVVVDAGNDSTICDGECAMLNGSARVIKKPAKTPTFRNIEVAPLFGLPDPNDLINLILPCLNFSGCQCPDGSSVSFLQSCPASFIGTLSMNINVTGLNTTILQDGELTNVCIEDIGMIAGTLVPFEITLSCPSGAQIILANSGDITGAAMTNACFDLNSTTPIASGTAPYTGNWQPVEPLTNLSGCDANGVWTLTFSGTFNFTDPNAAISAGFLNGWSLTFDDPEISYEADFTWSPTINMTNSNTLAPTVCPPATETYTLTAQDTAGCVVASDDVTVTVTPNCCTLEYTASSTQPDCGQNNGVINIAVTTGSGNYSYLLNGNPAAQNNTGLSSGIYVVSVFDLTQGCDIDTVITLQPSAAPVIDAIIVTDETCLGDSDGTATVSASGGTGTLVYDWSTSQTGQSVTGLPAGTHSVTVTDDAQCEAFGIFTINPGAVCCLLQIVSIDTTSETCIGDNDGTASVTVTGESGTVIFNWSTLQTGQSITGLPAGTHSVTVTDDAQCDVSASFTINAGPDCCDLNVTAQLVNPNCGQADGAITLAITGSGDYDFQWSNSETTQNISGLTAGSYTVTVHDITQNCYDTLTVNLSNSNANAPVIVNFSTRAETCLGDQDGTATVNVTNGNGTLTYLWSNSGTTQTITGLAPGPYSVTVTDSLNCQTIGSVTVPAGQVCCNLQSTASATDASCNEADGSITIIVDATSGTPPFQYSVDGVNFTPDSAFTGLPAGAYNAIARDANNCSSTNQVVIDEAGNTIAITLQKDDITCFGDNDGMAEVTATGGNGALAILWSTNATGTTIINLAPGTYSVTVSDTANCQRVDAVTITEPPQFIVNITGNLDFCAGESAMLDAGDFPQYVWSTTEITRAITVTQAGSYAVTVYDANGCEGEDAVTVSANPLPVVDAGLDSTIFSFESITLSPTVSGTPNPAGFAWSPALGLSCVICQNPIASPDTTTLYYLTYTDLSGCRNVDTLRITVLDGEFFTIVPNAFSPNGDNINDRLLIYHEGVESLVLRIYNRWGSLVFETRDPDHGWDGTFKGKLLDPDVFVYELYAEFINFNMRPQRSKGSITLLR